MNFSTVFFGLCALVAMLCSPAAEAAPAPAPLTPALALGAIVGGKLVILAGIEKGAIAGYLLSNSGRGPVRPYRG